MVFSFLFCSFLAFLSFFLATVIPLYFFSGGVQKSTLHIILGVSAGILFSIATADLIPEAISMSKSEPVVPKVQGVSSNFQAVSDSSKSRKMFQIKNENDAAEKDGGTKEEEKEKSKEEKLESEHEHEHTKADHKHEHTHDHKHEEKGHNHREEFCTKIAMLGVGIGFFTLLLMDRLLPLCGIEHSHSHGGGGHSHKDCESGSDDLNRTSVSAKFSYTAFVGLAIHSIVDGLVIGGSFSAGDDIGNRVTLALLLHKLPDGFVVASLLQALKRQISTFLVFLMSTMTPLGCIAGYYLFNGIPPIALGFFLGFAAGTFLFISGVGIIPELFAEDNHHEHRDAKKVNRFLPLFAVMIGYTFIFFVGSYLHSHSH